MNNYMEKLDMKDRKILSTLDLDSRQSFLKIGKKVGLSKNVVLYRIKRLENEGIITNYYTSIDFHKLGYINLAFYVNYQYCTPTVEKEIIDYFVQNPHSWWIANVQGKYDLAAYFLVKNLPEFFSFWQNTLNKYKFYFQDTIIAFFPRIHQYHTAFLLDELKKTNRDIFESKTAASLVELDDKDLQILHHMALNARISLNELAEILGSSTTMVAHRIKKLIKEGVIQGFRVQIDFSKLGYQLFNVHYSLRNYEKSQAIIDYMKTNKHLISIDEVIDHYDIGANYYLHTFHEMHEIIKDVYNKFPNDLKNHMTFTFPKIFKSNYFPGVLK
jgi:DNA-binding Lrp family transcriptional regulator